MSPIGPSSTGADKPFRPVLVPGQLNLNLVARNGHGSPYFKALETRARCGGPCALPAHHGLKLLSNLEVQLCDTFVELARSWALIARSRYSWVLARAAISSGLGPIISPGPSSRVWQRQRDRSRGI